MDWFQIGWLSVVSGICFISFYLVISLSTQVDYLKHKLSLHEDEIVWLSKSVTILQTYLGNHCMFCMYDMDPDREEENKE